MKPYRHEDGDYDWLTITEAVDRPGTALMRACRNGVGVTATEIDGIARAMWRACGLDSPVMLGRPNLDSVRDADGWVSFRGLRLRRSADDGVSFTIGGNMETLVVSQTRQLASVAAALTEGESDPGEVDELAAEIRADFQSDGTPPTEWEKKAARAALRWMNAREPRDA
jgi:hypothetical protein